MIFLLIGWGSTWIEGGLSALSFIIGAKTSMLCGFLGMMIATYSNARTTLACANNKGYTLGFNTAFRGGSVMGYALCSLGVLVLWILLQFYRKVYPDSSDWEALFDSVAGYGLGGSTIAMFGRVGGGIYTKAADVGADLVGKVEADIDEDDPHNPAVIAELGEYSFEQWLKRCSSSPQCHSKLQTAPQIMWHQGA